MKLDIKYLFISITIFLYSFQISSSSIEEIIKEAALKNNYLPSSALLNPQDEDLADVGEKLFDSHALSLNGETPCRSCHLEEFSSTDGIPNAIGVGVDMAQHGFISKIKQDFERLKDGQNEQKKAAVS